MSYVQHLKFTITDAKKYMSIGKVCLCINFMRSSFGYFLQR